MSTLNNLTTILTTILSEIILFWVFVWAIIIPFLSILPQNFYHQNPPNKDLVCTQKNDWFQSNKRYENCSKTEKNN